MVNLVRSEVRRLAWRRLPWVVLIIALVIVLALLWQFRSDAEALVTHVTTPEQSACLQAQDLARKTVPQANYHCDTLTVGILDLIHKNLHALLLVLTAAGLITGATGVGYDSSSGALSGYLLVEPRRGVVFLARGAATLIATMLLALPVAALMLAGLMFVYGSYFSNAETALGIGSVMQLAGKGVLLAGTSGLLGLAFSFLTKATGFAVTGALIWPVLESLFPQWDAGKYLLLPNLRNALTGSELLTSVACQGDGVCSSVSISIAPSWSWGYIAGIVFSLLVVSFLTFRARAMH